MRILTVRQPWAWAIIHGGKDVENRSTNIAGTKDPYRGPVAIHAGLSIGKPWEFVENARRVSEIGPAVPFGLTHGAIIGVVDLVDVHVVQQSHAGTNVCFDSTTPTGAICSPWAHAYDEFPGYRGHHLVLANPRPLADPIPYTGFLGLRNLAVRDPATALRVLAAIA